MATTWHETGFKFQNGRPEVQVSLLGERGTRLFDAVPTRTEGHMRSHLRLPYAQCIGHIVLSGKPGGRDKAEFLVLDTRNQPNYPDMVLVPPRFIAKTNGADQLILPVDDKLILGTHKGMPQMIRASMPETIPPEAAEIEDRLTRYNLFGVRNMDPSHDVIVRYLRPPIPLS